MTTANETESTRGELGQGLYSLRDLSIYLAYQGAPEDARRAKDWLTLVLNPVAHTRWRPDYSFSDLISLFVVRELLRRGVRPSRIRKAEAYLRSLWRTDRPFVSDKIATDGLHVYIDETPVSGKPEQVEAADLHGQHAMVEPIRDHLRSVRYHDGNAHQWRPIEHVVLDPEVQFGDPVIEGTRVPTAEIAAAANKIGPEQAATIFDVRRVAVESAQRFEQRLAQLRAAR